MQDHSIPGQGPFRLGSGVRIGTGDGGDWLGDGGIQGETKKNYFRVRIRVKGLALPLVDACTT